MVSTGGDNPRGRRGIPALAGLIRMLGEPDQFWLPEELGPILRHQLAAPLHPCLQSATADGGSGGAAEMARRLDALADGWPELAVGTFGDLLRHPRPPPHLLELVTAYAAARRAEAAEAGPGGPLPAEVADVLYHASIAAAVVRLGRGGGGDDNETLRQDLSRAAAWDWVDEATRSLLREAAGSLRSLNSG